MTNPLLSHRLPLLLLLLLFVCLSSSPAFAFDPTERPRRNASSPRSDDNFVNPIKKNPKNTTRPVHIRVFSRIPVFNSTVVPGRSFPSSLVGLTSFGNQLFVTTSSAGAYIYRVFPSGKAFLWANIQEAVLRDTGRNVNCETAQHGGLRAVAFPPDHRRTGLFYVSFMEDRPTSGADADDFVYLSRPMPFTRPIVADSVVVEFHYDYAKRQVTPGSYRTVVRVGLNVKDHPIKQIAFQGENLLIAHGDGAIGSNPSPGGMNNDALGKILRVHPKKPADGSGRAYTVPADNPFVGDDRYLDEIYAVGFRNPHNLCWSAAHGLFVADVGRDNVEEVNLVTSGGNYGWGEREGTFVNLYKGGTLSGIAPLPADDAKYGYTYPVAQIGHWQPVGGQIRWGIAIAGGCPVETRSPLRGVYFYTNFGERGELFYSWVGQMKRVKTKGNPDELDQANVYRTTNILFDHDGNPNTPPKKVQSLVELVRVDSGLPRTSRVDARFGRGPRGEIYITSKRTGTIYLITSTLPGAKQ